jgi:hypothetical protein
MKKNKVNLKQMYVYKSQEFSVFLGESLEHNIQKMRDISLLNQMILVNSTECEKELISKYKILLPAIMGPNTSLNCTNQMYNKLKIKFCFKIHF